MQIVIDIDKKKYEEIKRIAKAQLELTDKTEAQIIANGILLPEGHGDLIDRDALIQKQFIPNVGWELVDLDDLKTAPTVIPADK